MGQLRVGESEPLGPPRFGPTEQRRGHDPVPLGHDPLQLADEPGVDARTGHDLVHARAAAQRRLQLEDAVRGGDGDPLQELGQRYGVE